LSGPNDADIKRYSLDEIPPNSFFSKTACLNTNFVLAAPEMPFDSTLIETLKAWGFTEVLSGGEILEDYSPDAATESGLIVSNDDEDIKKAEKFYGDFKQYAEDLFLRAAITNDLNYESVAEKIAAVCNTVKEERRYLLRVNKNTTFQHHRDFLGSHAVNSTIISLIIGQQLKLPNHKLIELGVAALLHEIGMIKLPPNFYLADKPLGKEEWKAIQTHPLLGFSMLKSRSFPYNINLAALEHHERENGEGYPQHLTGDKISLYGKIVAVACSYEALSSNRPYKEAKNGYTGMLELLRNEGKRYDDTIVRALVFSLSLYPIGLHVLLSSGKQGMVVDVNHENPQFPIVQVFGEFTPDGKNKIVETSQDGITIVRPLTKEEAGTS
jgi:HD-GYP domain-containing protein (c-di-GMP phosphodiesterase class II)